MTLLEAIGLRHSVRRYQDKPLEEGAVRALSARIAEINAATGLHVQLVRDEQRAFRGVFAYGKFSGVSNYLVMAGRREPGLDERIGYYGEELVLLAQTLGLNTCWAGLSYTKVRSTYVLAPGEKIACYIAVGYGVTQGSARRSKTVQQVSNAGPETPSWFMRGVEAALLAPTAINQQKFYLEYVEGGVRARRLRSLVGYTEMDLGIVKRHFEIGAGVPVLWL